MIQTKTEQQRDNEIRARLEDITAQLVKVQDKIDQLPYKEIANDKLRPLCEEKARLEAEKYKLINLLNMVN